MYETDTLPQNQWNLSLSKKIAYCCSVKSIQAEGLSNCLSKTNKNMNTKELQQDLWSITATNGSDSGSPPCFEPPLKGLDPHLKGTIAKLMLGKWHLPATSLPRLKQSQIKILPERCLWFRRRCIIHYGGIKWWCEMVDRDISSIMELHQVVSSEEGWLQRWKIGQRLLLKFVRGTISTKNIFSADIFC